VVRGTVRDRDPPALDEHDGKRVAWGVQSQAYLVRDDRHRGGRRFEPRNEPSPGGAASQFAGAEVGRALEWAGNKWTVVGIFDAGGTVADSELWCDGSVLAPMYRRGASFQVVRARLESPATFDRLNQALTSDPRLNLKVVRESEYYAEQSQMIAT
jgi:putative ABC transport system permease protein